MKLFSQYKGLNKGNYILFIGRVVTSLGSMVWSMVTLILRQKLGMNAADIGLAVMIVGILAIPMTLIGGKLADRYSRKNIIVICDCVSIFGFLWCGFQELTILNMVIFVTAAMFQQMEGPAYSALVADITPSEDRERAYSLNYMGMNVGMILSPTIAGLLFQNYLWLAFIINGCAIGVSTLLIFLFLKEPERQSESDNEYEKGNDTDSVWTILKNSKILILFIVIMSLANGVRSQYSYLMPLDFSAVHGDYGAVLYGTITSLNCIIVVLCTPLITAKFAKMSEPARIFIGEALTIIAFILFRSFLGFIPMYYAAFILLTWGEIFCTTMEAPYLSRRIPNTHRGRIISVLSVVNTLTFAFSEYIEGIIYDSLGSWASWIAIISLGIVGLLLTLWFMKKDKICFPSFYQKEIDTDRESMQNTSI